MTIPPRRRRAGAVAAALVVLGASLVAVAAPIGSERAAALPAGVTASTVADVASPTTVEQLPDGRVVVLQQGGQVRLIEGGTLVAQPALTLAVCTGSERGLLGFTAGPGFLTDGQVIVYATRVAPGAPGGCVNRVSRFTMVGDVIDPATEVVLLDGISSVNGNHNGGDLAIGRDGYLYVSVGDAGRDPRGDSGTAGANDAAQDLSLVNGKILRVSPVTGEAAPDNPLVGAGAVSCRVRGNTAATPRTPCAELYAWGLRNPWRMAFDPNGAAQRFFVNDVGQSTREEVDLGAAGADYGWNAREGACPAGQSPPCAGPPPGVTDPILDYGHRGARAFITAGAFVPDGAWPAEFAGGYLFGDGGSGEVWLRHADGSADLDAPVFTGLQGLADMAFVREADGWALYATLAQTTTASVRRFFVPFATAEPSPPLAYVPAASSTRLLDTREGVGGGVPLRAGVAREVATGAGPSTRAVLVNLAYVAPATDGFLTAWAAGAPRPGTANVNAVAGEVVSNLAIVPVDAAGRMQLWSYADAHVVVDLLGRFVAAPAPVAAGRFQAVTPSRLADTREPAGTANLFTRATGDRYPVVRVPVLGRGGIPASGVASVALVVTALSGDGPEGGFLTATAGGAPWPGTANLNVGGARDVRPNTVIVPVAADGTIDLHLFRVADVVVDVSGWFTDASAAPGASGRFVSIPPTREVDTRIGLGFGRLPAGGVGVRDPGSVPADAAALAHVTAIVDPAGPGFVTPYPGGPRPFVAAGNVTAPGQVRSILALTRLGGGTISWFTYSETDLVVDVAGWFEG